MKRTRNYFWPIRPDVNFHKFLRTLKIVTILLFCGLVLPTFSLSAENSSGNDLSGSVVDQQQIKVSGTVTNALTGETLTGVNVVVTGTNVGTITDIDGKYSIEVPPGSQSLTFSFIGMDPQEITIGASTQINVTMVETAFGLNEVVVIGYGTMKEK